MAPVIQITPASISNRTPLPNNPGDLPSKNPEILTHQGGGLDDPDWDPMDDLHVNPTPDGTGPYGPPAPSDRDHAGPAPTAVPLRLDALLTSASTVQGVHEGAPAPGATCTWAALRAAGAEWRAVV